MSTVLDHPHTTSRVRPHSVGPISSVETAPGDRMRATMAAARLSFTWLSVQKSLTLAQKN